MNYGTALCPTGVYTIELISASDTSATIKVTDAQGRSQAREITEGNYATIQGIPITVVNADETNLKLSATITVGTTQLVLTSASPIAQINFGSSNSCFNGACGGGGISGNVTTKFPDLVPKVLSVKGGGMFNATACNVTASANITNIGSAPAGASQTEFSMTGSPSMLFATPALNPGAWAGHSKLYSLTLGKSYTFKVMADKTLVVKESNEVNNPQRLEFSVTSCNFFKDIIFNFDSNGNVTGASGGGSDGG